MIEKIKMFLAICLEGSSLKAAEVLHVTQPAVSQGIKELENILEVKLFERQGRRLVLSANGTKFIPYAQEYIRTHESALLAFKKPEMKLRVGSSMTIATTVLPDIISSCEDAFPIKFQVEVTNASTVKEKLVKNELDLALIEGQLDSEQYLYYPLADFHLKFVATPAYIEKNRQQFESKSYDFLVREPGSSYRRQFDTFCVKNNLVIQPKWECSTNEIIIYTVLKNQGVALLPIEAIASYIETGALAIIELNQATIKETYGLAVNKLRVEEYSIRTFIDFMVNK